MAINFVQFSTLRLASFHRKALEVVDRYFPILLTEQGFLETKEAWEKVLVLLPGGVQRSLRTEFEEDSRKSSVYRWDRIVREVVCGGGG